MANGRDNQLAKQIGESLVWAELGRRGIIATAFSGNVPKFDILAASDKCNTLPIQVKASAAGKFPDTATNGCVFNTIQLPRRRNILARSKFLILI